MAGEFKCKDCGAALMPLHHKAATCPNGHGRVRINMPAQAVKWYFDQYRRGRTKARCELVTIEHVAVKTGRNTIWSKVYRVEGDSQAYVIRHVMRDNGRSASVPLLGEDIPDDCLVGVIDGCKVRMLKPATSP